MTRKACSTNKQINDLFSLNFFKTSMTMNIVDIIGKTGISFNPAREDVL